MRRWSVLFSIPTLVHGDEGEKKLLFVLFVSFVVNQSVISELTTPALRAPPFLRGNFSPAY